jgi:hypothetical protein
MFKNVMLQSPVDNLFLAADTDGIVRLRVQVQQGFDSVKPTSSTPGRSISYAAVLGPFTFQLNLLPLSSMCRPFRERRFHAIRS